MTLLQICDKNTFEKTQTSLLLFEVVVEVGASLPDDSPLPLEAGVFSSGLIRFHMADFNRRTSIRFARFAK